MDAILGVLGYRVMLECKLNTTPLVRPDIAEAAKYRDQYGAQHAIVVANAYAAERETLDECETHRVSLWTTDDLLRVLTLGIDAYELRTVFAPGLAANALTDVEWSRAHADARVRGGRRARDRPGRLAVRARDRTRRRLACNMGSPRRRQRTAALDLSASRAR